MSAYNSIHTSVMCMYCWLYRMYQKFGVTVAMLTACYPGLQLSIEAYHHVVFTQQP